MSPQELLLQKHSLHLVLIRLNTLNRTGYSKAP